MEKWKNGKVEEWKTGRMEGWNDGLMDLWNDTMPDDDFASHNRSFFRVPLY